MYGTVATMRLKSGQEAKLNEVMERWWRDQAPKAKGIMNRPGFDGGSYR